MARDPRDGYRDAVTFGQFVGLRNTVTRERLKPEELERALNVDIDDAGEVRRRRGKTRVATGTYHSLWESDGITLVVKDGTLGYLHPDYSHTPLQTGVGPTRLAYARIKDTTYFAGATISGKIMPDDTVQDWGAVDDTGTWLSPVVNPTAYLDEVHGRYIEAPPVATSLLAKNGRIWLAHDNVLWATEYFLFDYVDKARNFIQFESPITALGGVGGGFYVGTERATYFMSGPLGQMEMTKVNDYGVLPGSMVPVTAEMVRPERNQSREAVVFMTNHGVCAGLDSGVCYNMTEQRVVLPEATSVAAMFRQQDGLNQYVGVADHGGTPSSKARIGDYVDAEIRRFQGV